MAPKKPARGAPQPSAAEDPRQDPPVDTETKTPQGQNTEATGEGDTGPGCVTGPGATAGQGRTATEGNPMAGNVTEEVEAEGELAEHNRVAQQLKDKEAELNQLRARKEALC